MPPNLLLPRAGRPRIRTRGYLPHWELPGANYSITFRLHDSLPKSVLARLARERLAIEEQGPSAIQRMELALAFERQLDRDLDAHHGVAYMRDPRIADVVAAALCFFDGIRYRLDAWCVMPNHVHAIVQPFDDWTLDDILHSWKSYSANAANRILQRRGTFWYREYFDRIIRNERDLERTRVYVLENPSRAGLVEWRWSSAGWKPAVRPAGSRRS